MLQEMRQKKGYSQSTLAKVSGIPLKTIQHYETGYRDINLAKINTLCLLSLSLDCKIDDILTDEKVKALYRKVK